MQLPTLHLRMGTFVKFPSINRVPIDKPKYPYIIYTLNPLFLTTIVDQLTSDDEQGMVSISCQRGRCSMPYPSTSDSRVTPEVVRGRPKRRNLICGLLLQICAGWTAIFRVWISCLFLVHVYTSCIVEFWRPGDSEMERLSRLPGEGTRGKGR